MLKTMNSQRIKISLVLLLLLPFTASTVFADRGIKVTSEFAGVSQSRRIALIIGNSDYKTSPLKNPVNDAEDIAYELERLGFQVQLGRNMTRTEMRIAIRNFGNEIKKGGVGLFYYAGHGMQVRGKNFLIPIGSDIRSEDEVEYESIDAGLVLAKMESAGNLMNIVMLDACRDNPFARSFRSVQKGLAQMDAPSGSLIVYATAPGSVAADGGGRNGVFTRNFLAHVRNPDLEIGQMLKRVRAGVQRDTDGQQVPWESSSLVGDFYFVEKNAVDLPGKVRSANDDLLERERLNLEEDRRALAAEKHRFQENQKQLKMAMAQPRGGSDNPSLKDDPLAIERARLDAEKRQLEEDKRRFEETQRQKERLQLAEEKRKLEEEKRRFEDAQRQQERMELAEEKRKLAEEKRRLLEEQQKLRIAKASPGSFQTSSWQDTTSRFGGYSSRRLSGSQKFAPMLKNAKELMAMVEEDLKAGQGLKEAVRQEFQKALTLLKDASMKANFKSTHDNMQVLKKLAVDRQLGDTVKYSDFAVLTIDQSIELARQQNR